ncbi:hypothetical protein SDJN03_09867, partial [Cucurbita argyrosperma subsp. sororia]
MGLYQCKLYFLLRYRYENAEESWRNWRVCQRLCLIEDLDVNEENNALIAFYSLKVSFQSFCRLLDVRIGEPSVTVNVVSESISSSHMCRLFDLTYRKTWFLDVRIGEPSMTENAVSESISSHMCHSSDLMFLDVRIGEPSVTVNAKDVVIGKMPIGEPSVTVNAKDVMIGRMPICYEDIAVFYAISVSPIKDVVIGKMPIGEPFVTVNAVSESISFHMCRLSDLTFFDVRISKPCPHMCHLSDLMYGSFVNVITIYHKVVLIQEQLSKNRIIIDTDKRGSLEERKRFVQTYMGAKGQAAQ